MNDDSIGATTFSFYEVTVFASVQMLIEATSEDEALSIAYEEVDFDYAGVKDVQLERELTTDEEIDQLARLGDQAVYM